MVKIKRKVTLEPKEFLKHSLEKEETKVELNGYSFDGSNYSFDPEVTVNEVVSYHPNENTYTVEVEEEITEETKIPVLVEVAKINESSEDIRIYYYRGISISEATNNIIASKSFYMLNDDYTMTLLWKDGGMVV